VVLGRYGGKTLMSRGQEHVLLLGPTESGKTINCAIPTVLSWRDPEDPDIPSLFILDLKGSIAKATITQRADLGPVYVWDPTSPTSIGLNPFDGIRLGTDSELDDARAIAHALVVPGNPPHWHLAAESLIEGAILHLCYGGGHPSLGGLHTFFGRLMEPAIMQLQLSAHPEARLAARQMLNRSENEAGAVWSTANTFVSLYRGHIARATEASDVHPADLIMGPEPITLYLQIDPSMLESLAPLIGLLVRRFIAEMTRGGGGHYRRRLVMLLDEVIHLGYLSEIEKGVALLRDYGLKFVLIGQSIQQLYKVYTEHTAILDNCKVQVVYGSSNLRTNEYYSTRLAQQTITQEQTRRSGARFGVMYHHEQSSLQQVGRALLFADEIERLGSAQELIFIEGQRPILARKLIVPERDYQGGKG
jgi:type IV secretion system protein VirD4